MHEAMEEIRADRRLVRRFFGHPAVAYVKQALHASFLSRIERGVVAVPEQLVRDLSKALGMVEEPLLVLAGHLPEDVEAILLEHPERSLALLREQLGPKRTRSRPAPSSGSAAAPEAQGRGA